MQLLGATHEQIIADLRILPWIPYWLRISPTATFYRVRKCDPGQQWPHFDNMKYRPAEGTIYGRANLAGRPVAYASLAGMATALLEIGAEPGDRIQVLGFTLDGGVRSYAVGNACRLLYAGSAMFGNAEETALHFRGFREQIGEDAFLAHILADGYLAEEFSKPAKRSWEYKISAAFGDIVHGEGIETISYPSVEHLGGTNIAISKEFFDQHVRMQSCTVMEIVDYLGYGIYSLRWGDNGKSCTGLSDSGEFIWGPPDESCRPRF